MRTTDVHPALFRTLAYGNPRELVFGRSLRPVQCGFDLHIGAGTVFPEVNYTLKPTSISASNFDEIRAEYREMVESVLSRATKLGVEGVVLEFEHLPELTRFVDLGASITQQTKELMASYHRDTGLRSALRATVCDIRDLDRPPKMRTGQPVETMFDAFRRNAEAGADLLSIESTGGKEVSDHALIEADVPGLLFALGVLAPRDMAFLWGRICGIAEATGVVAAGDTACGFGNTAMVLADQGLIPATLAAIVRAMTAVRSLVALESGAVGPSKDCAYEGPVLKAIAGIPISMEGKSAACAHFSHVGNIAAAACDLWSNESVQNVRLLAGSAPECFTEMLAYDCRLFNGAIAAGDGERVRDLLVASDKTRSLHAFIIAPDVSFEIARAIIAQDSYFARTRAAGLKACELIRAAAADGSLPLPEREERWLALAERDLEEWDSESTMLSDIAPKFEGVVDLAEYGF